MENFDYIITGAGAAGLSLALKLANDNIFEDKKILLLDKDNKTAYDRTWCFWDTENNFFSHIVSKKWDKLLIKTTNNSGIFDIRPFSYNLIKSSDFYRNVLNVIHSKKNIHFRTEEILEIRPHGSVVTNRTIYHGDYIFNSIGNPIVRDKANVTTLLQHFKGWEVRMENPVFNPDVATLMDFDIDQKGDCRFVYVLPYDTHTAMIEYTIFSESLLDQQEYTNELIAYLKRHYNDEPFRILHEEYGVIPMSDYNYSAIQHSKVVNIGTIGGATKASTGYTFYFIQKQTDFYIKQLKKGKIKTYFKPKYKYRLYDSVLLKVLKDRKIPAYKIFENLFFKLKIQLVLKFLSERTNMFEDILIMSKVNIPVFAKAMVSRVMHLD